MHKDIGKGIATTMMWIVVGIVAAFAPEHTTEVASTVGVATVLLWIFG